MADEIEWGAEIPVDGVRPDWLRDDETPWCQSRHDNDWYSWRDWSADQYYWHEIIAIRLPADHEFYRRKEPASEPISDDRLQAQIGEVGNQVHNLGCELQNNEDVRDRLSELAGCLWDLAKVAASEPVAPPGYVLVKQMTEEEWWKTTANGMTVWARNQGIILPETLLDRFARETGTTITEQNRAQIEAALAWERDA